MLCVFGNGGAGTEAPRNSQSGFHPSATSNRKQPLLFRQRASPQGSDSSRRFLESASSSSCRLKCDLSRTCRCESSLPCSSCVRSASPNFERTEARSDTARSSRSRACFIFWRRPLWGIALSSCPEILSPALPVLSGLSSNSTPTAEFASQVEVFTPYISLLPSASAREINGESLAFS